jgi:peptidoglycan LD-endopeptidase LytH
MPNPRSRAPSTLRTVVLAAMLVGVLMVPANAEGEPDLESAKSKLSALVDKLDAETATVGSLQAESNQLAARLSRVQSRIAGTEDRARALRAELGAAANHLAQLQGQLDDRARAAYEQGPGQSIEVLLGAASFQQFTNRLEYLGRAQRNDSDLAAEVVNRRVELGRKQAEVERLRLDLLGARRQLAADQDAVTAKLAAAKDALDALQADRTRAQGLVQQLTDRREREMAAARLAAQQRAIQHAHPPTSASATIRSSDVSAPAPPARAPGGSPFSVCPVDPPRAYSDDFGAPRSGHTHQGNDILAPGGTPVRAPFAGTAANATNSVGGLSVNVMGVQGFVYNAHLSRIGSLGSVSAGTAVGYVGNSGNAAGGPTHDHFEWHPGNGAAVDPYPYLNQVC